MTPNIPSVPLNNGKQLPLFGLGTWNAKEPEELRAALRVALDNGYRLIDTAFAYQNEGVIGEILDEYFKAGKLKREEIFITTKLPPMAMSPAAVEPTVKKQLEALRVDYIDLYLIHIPTPMSFKDPAKPDIKDMIFDNKLDHIDTWRAMEKLYKAGTLKAIGVSNFNVKQLTDLYDKAEIKPSNLQVELHIYWPQHELHELCKKLGMTITAYGPIGSPGRKASNPTEDWPDGNTMEDPVVVELSKKYNKTPAQIQLRHLIQRGVSVIPKSTNAKRVVENISIFDFELSPEDQRKLIDIKRRTRLFVFNFARGHRYFPFEDLA